MNPARERRSPHRDTGRPSSRNTTFRPTPPPNKFFLTVDEMLRISYDLGSVTSDRQVAKSNQRSPTTVGQVRKRALGLTSKRKLPDYTPPILAHFVAFSLIENHEATGQAIAEAARECGLVTSKSSVNRFASEMQFQTIFAQKTEKLLPKHKEYREYFAQNIFTWHGFHLPWIFTDESMIVMNPVRKKIRVLRGVELDKKYVALGGYPIKVMIWGRLALDSSHHGKNFREK